MLLQRQLQRKNKHKEKLQAKMSKIISVEKTKILKHVEEINSLKVDNMKLIGQLQEQQSAMTKMSEQIKTLEEIEPIDDLKVKLQNVTGERDYLHTMLQDNVV